MRPPVRPRRVLVYLMAASVPLLMFLNAWQGVRYTRLREEVRRLEDEQEAWFERNKNLLTAIGIYTSPKRLDALAGQDPLARESTEDGATRVELEPGAGGR